MAHDKIMEEISRLFYGDEVYLKCPKSNILKIGLVLKGTEWKVNDDSKKIEVLWHPDGNKEMISANKVTLMDRSLVTGCTVSKYHDGKPVGQLGYCENVDVYTNVHVSSTSKMITNVCGDDFNHTTAFQIGSTVNFHLWIGEIFDVIETYMFASEDGSIFSLEDPYKEYFITSAINPNFSMDNGLFRKLYAGQQLKMYLDAMENAKFLKSTSEMQKLLLNHQQTKFTKWVNVIVQHVEVSSVEIKWCPQQCPATYALGTNVPPKIFTKYDLEKLDTFSSRAIHLGDLYSYTIKDYDQIAELEEWKKLYSEIFNINLSDLPQFKLEKQRVYNEFGDNEITAMKWQKHNQKIEKKIALKSISRLPVTITINNGIQPMKMNRMRLKPFGRRSHDNIQGYPVGRHGLDLRTNVLVEVLNTKTLADVVWADGTRDIGIAATKLYAVQDDTYSLKYKPGVFVFPENPKTCVYGVLESTQDVERTSRVCVQWFNMEGSSRKVTTIPKIMNESIQKLRYHPMYNLKFGTLVIAFEEVPRPPRSFTIGKVMGVGKDGKISVTWTNGKLEKHWPQKLLVIKNGFTYQHIFRDNLLHSEWLISKPNCSRAMTSTEEIEKCLLDLLKQGNDGIRTLTKCVYFNAPSIDLLDELEEAIELVMKGFYVIPFFACEKFQSELEKIYKSIVQLVIQTIETAYQRFYGEKQEIDELKDLIDNLFICLTGKISDYTDKIEEILVNYLSTDQET